MKSIRSAAAVLGVLIPLSGSCGANETELIVELQRATTATFTGVNALSVRVRSEGTSAPERFPVYPLAGNEQQALAATATPGTPFYVDVWGCPGTDNCGPDTLIARGCTDVLIIPEGTVELRVPVVMEDWVDAETSSCPPDL